MVVIRLIIQMDLAKMMEKKSPRGRGLTAATQSNAIPDSKLCTAVALMSVLLSGKRLIELVLLLMGNSRGWMVGLARTKLVGTTLDIG